MTRHTGKSPSDLDPKDVRLDCLLGRRVLSRNNETVGRVEEFRAEKRGSGAILTEYVIGRMGLLERLGVGFRLLIGRHQPAGFIARWDQLDISNPERPRLLCTPGELRKL
jgi:hypothetical protein